MSPTLLEFDVGHIVAAASSPNAKGIQRTNKRLFEHIESPYVYDVANTETGITEWITILDRSISFVTDTPASLMTTTTTNEVDADEDNNEMIDVEFVLSNCKMALEATGLLTLKSQLPGAKSTTPKKFLSLHTDMPEEDITALRLLIESYNYLGGRKLGNRLRFQGYDVTIRMDYSVNLVSININFQLASLSSLVPYPSAKIVAYMHKLIDPYLVSLGPHSSAIGIETFYEAITDHTAKLPPVEHVLPISELCADLFPFQRKSVKWMLQQEHMAITPVNSIEPMAFIHPEIVDRLKRLLLLQLSIHGDHEIDECLLTLLGKLCFGWSRFKEDLFYNPFTGALAKRSTVVGYFIRLPKDEYEGLPGGGLLSEEMGLGKTVEIASLLIANKRPESDVGTPLEVQMQQFGDIKVIERARTTLIVAPSSILLQWVGELKRLAPSLAITTYKGVSSHEYKGLLNTPKLVAKYLSQFDVVFATYDVIANELDYALYSSRNRRTRNATKRVKYDEQKDEIEVLGVVDPNHERFFEFKVKLIKPPTPNTCTLAEGSEEYDDQKSDYERMLLLEFKDIVMVRTSNAKLLPRPDYLSPLMMLQFWRVVLDEVQMVSSTISRAFQTASLIPKHHGWGVSGTPIKRKFNDLHSVLKYLKYVPFYGELGDYNWELVAHSDALFRKLWTQIAIRHTKSMVESDLKLPPQHRVLMTIPFSAVEQEYYNQMFAECVYLVGLDLNGQPKSDSWLPTPGNLATLRSWLVKLRQACCNMQVGKLSKMSLVASKKLVNVMGLKSLNDLLLDMLDKSEDSLIDVEREIVQQYSDLGELFEFIYEPETALSFLKVGSYKVDCMIVALRSLILRDVQTISKIIGQTIKQEYQEEVEEEEPELDEKIISQLDANIKKEVLRLRSNTKINILRVRNWLLMQHRFYFLIGSSFFQLHDEEYQKLISYRRLPNFSLSKSLTKFKSPSATALLSTLVCDILLGDLESSHPTPEVKAEDTFQEEYYKKMELQYYSLAEDSRNRILKSSTNAFTKSIDVKIKSREEFDFFFKGTQRDDDEGLTSLPKATKKIFRRLPKVNLTILDNVSLHMSVDLFINRLKGMLIALNTQAETINLWMNDLFEVIVSPLLTQDQDPDGEEYEKSFRDQDKASCLLHIVMRALTDREKALQSSTDKIIASASDSAMEPPSINNKEMLEAYELERKNVMPTLKLKASLDGYMTEFKELIGEMEFERGISSETRELQLQLLELVITKLAVILKNQISSISLLRRELSNSCNSVFNTRVAYFKQLQQLSDSVQKKEYGLDQDSLDGQKIDVLQASLVGKLQQIAERSSKAISKLRYVRALAVDRDGEDKEGTNGNDDDDDDGCCIICSNVITIGSLTPCGHSYCRDCLLEWLRSHHTCPVCKSFVSVGTIHDFIKYKPDLKVKQVVPETESMEHSRPENLFTIYKALGEESISRIQNMEINSYFGSKVDLIVKQVLFLKSEDPDVQIVVFSQWRDLLYILGTAFNTVGVSYIASQGLWLPKCELLPMDIKKGRKRGDEVDLFKNKSKGITCFLLDARAQASGLTLVNAKHMFLCDPLVNTSLELQAISRIHRIGQRDETTVWMFAIDNSVEENIVLMSTQNRLKYLGENDDKKITMAESLALMSSGGNDTMISSHDGEVVSNDDTWTALFSRR